MSGQCIGDVPNQGSVTFRRCSRSGTVKRGGKWYCNAHDPVASQERSNARDMAWREEADSKWKKRSDDAHRLACFPTLLSAAKAVAGLDAEEARMRKEYPAGTCNSEDAWRDFGKEHHKAWKDLRSAIAKAQGEAGNG